MSDIFDHEADAWDSYDTSWDEDGHSGGASGDPNYYHSWVETKGKLRQTPKAIMYAYLPGVNIWVAKSLIRGYNGNKIFVHLGSFNRIVTRRCEELIHQSDGLENLDG